MKEVCLYLSDNSISYILITHHYKCLGLSYIFPSVTCVQMFINGCVDADSLIILYLRREV